MNFFTKRKFRKHDSLIVRLAVKHFDRPTDLKNAFLELNKSDDELIEAVKTSIPVYKKFPPVQDDLRLATLRAVCSKNPHLYSLVIDNFPEIENDFRGVQSLNFYKNKTLDFFLGIESENEHEYLGDGEDLIDEQAIEILPLEHDIFQDIRLGDDNDFGLISAADSTNRTLKQLTIIIENAVSDLEAMECIDFFKSLLGEVIYRKLSVRSVRDFFVASLRVLGKNEPSAAIDYGYFFLEHIPDHRAMRSMIIFLRKDDRIEDAIRLMYHPNFKHDNVTREWQEQLNIRRKELILDDKLRPKFEQFGDNFEALSEFMDDLYRTMNGDLDIARYMYKYCIELHNNVQNKPIANEVIRWGEAIFKLEKQNISVENVTQTKEEFSKEISDQKTAERYEREIRRMQQSIPMRVGLYLTNATKNPFKLITLPILFPIFCFKLGLERIGYKNERIEVAVSQIEDGRKDCIVLFPTNGVGFGHFTRLYAVARAIRKLNPQTEVIFFTPMPTLHILYSDNFPTYHLAGRYKHSEMSARQWNSIVEEMLTIVFETHKPKTFVFDGAYPYRGMLNAINAQEGMAKWWMRRGTFKKNKSIPAGSLDSFDYTISPQDIEKYESSEIDSPSSSKNVPPITLIEEDEMFSKHETRSLLSVPQDCKLVYVQLGAGRINEIGSTINIVIEELLTYENVYVVLGDSLLGQRTIISKEKVRIIRDYPNALYFKGFDAAIQAGGYNSFHEMRRLHLPTVFIPNTNTGMDDQLKRVKQSQKEGWGIVSKDNRQSIKNAIQQLFQIKQPKPPNHENGATVTAEVILEEMSK